MVPSHRGVLSCSTVPFDGYDLGLAFGAIAEAGFSWTEIGFIEGYVSDFREELFGDESIQNVRGLLATNGLSASGVSAHIDLGQPDSVERIERRLRFCAGVGSPRLITNAAAKNAEDTFYRNMEKIIPMTEREGIVLCLENPGNGVENVVNDGTSAASVAEKLASSHVRINYDGGNTFSQFRRRFPAETDFAPALDWLEQLHLKDVRTRSDGDYEYPALGDGRIDFGLMAQTAARAVDLRVLCVEIPLRLRRRPDGSPYRTTGPLPFTQISEIVARSRSNAAHHFGGILAQRS